MTPTITTPCDDDDFDLILSKTFGKDKPEQGKIFFLFIYLLTK